MPDQVEIHRLTQDKDSDMRCRAAYALGDAFSYVPDKALAWQDLIRLTQDKNIFVRSRAAEFMGNVFSHVPDKALAWQDLIRLTQDKDSYVRSRAAYALGDAFSYVPDKALAWQDLIRLTQDKDSGVRWRATRSLGDAFSHVPDKALAWQDLIRLTQDKDALVRSRAANVLGDAFSHVPDKALAWQDLIRLTREDKDIDVRWGAAKSLGDAFSHVPDKALAWQKLIRLIQDKDIDVRSRAAKSLGDAFSYVPDKALAWQDLIRLTREDKDSDVRMYAYHSLGRASVLKATESDDKDIMKKELEAAVAFFEKSSQESARSPARFCYPFYRSYFAITFQEAKEDEVQRYLVEAKKAVGGSESKDELLLAVENLAQALQESQKLKDRSLEEITSELNTYRWYCEKAASHMDTAEKSAPGAVKLMRKCNPIIVKNQTFYTNYLHQESVLSNILQSLALKRFREKNLELVPSCDRYHGQSFERLLSLCSSIYIQLDSNQENILAEKLN